MVIFNKHMLVFNCRQVSNPTYVVYALGDTSTINAQKCVQIGHGHGPISTKN